ncbi:MULTISPECIES: hypothetical protein [unclassified Bacillus (in: firmicutes)]|nr:MULTISPECIES: hypothetical protein [unclassified Bacillus (in: firmicutes)]MBT2637997.1 hypothetical protein [Bacillus sp. ISL-39]MBT2661172.1 hypothetical protein [Bacillus sp. ISL-45]
MDQPSDLDLAYLIILIDTFRDELFEELLERQGNHAQDLLRAAQNGIY